MSAADRPLLGLTLWRPWPILIARGIKTIENRPWNPEHPRRQLERGQWFCIHSGKVWDDACIPMSQRLGVPIEIFSERVAKIDSAIIAVARYDGFVIEPRNLTEAEAGWWLGPCAWRVPEVVEIDPVPCKGAQGLWRVPPALADQVRDAWKTARAA